MDTGTKMKMLTHVVLVTIIVTSALIGGVILTSDLLLVQNLEDSERAVMTASCSLVNQTIQHEIDMLAATCRDWAMWDDTYFFVLKPDQAYIDSNLVDQTYINNGLDCFLIVDTAETLVYGKIFDAEKQTAVPIPDSLFARIEELLRKQRTTVDSWAVEGIITLPDGPMIVAAEPILRNTGEGPAVGSLIMGRYIDDEWIGDVSDSTLMSVTLLTAGNTSIYSDLSPGENKGEGPSSLVTIAPSENGTIISSIITVADIYGRPAFTTRVDLARDLYRQGFDAIYSSILIIIGICAAMGMILIFSFNRTVILPLETMSSMVASLRDDHDYSRRIPEEGITEIKVLSTSMNTLFSSLQSSIELQKESEACLRESEEKYHTLFESANDGIFILRDRRFEDCNARALEVFGRTKEEMVGERIERFSPEYQPDGQRSVDTASEYLQRAYAGESLTFTWEYLTPEGTHRSAEITAKRLDLRSGAYLLVIARDVTRQIEMERLKTEAFGQIEQNLEQLAILNDEIRNPLQVILAIVEMDPCKETKPILTQVKIINDLINQLDRGYIESEKVREFLRKHYNIGGKK